MKDQQTLGVGFLNRFFIRAVRILKNAMQIKLDQNQVSDFLTFFILKVLAPLGFCRKKRNRGR